MSTDEVKSLTGWLRHAVHEKWLTPQAVIDAADSPYPNRAVLDLVLRAEQGAAADLNEIVRDISGSPEPTYDAVMFAFNPATSYHDAYCSIANGALFAVSVESLQREPYEIAHLVCQTLDVISLRLVQFLVPRDVWLGEEFGWYEELRDEMARLIHAGAGRDLEGAVAALGGVQSLNSFSGSPRELQEQFNRYRALLTKPPCWMTPTRRMPTPEQLRARARVCQIKYAPTPWTNFVLATLDAIAKYGRSPPLDQDSYGDEGEIPFGRALAVFSDSVPERRMMEDLHEVMMNAGETAVANIGLHDIPVGALRASLLPFAALLGLLLLAARCDTERRHTLRRA